MRVADLIMKFFLEKKIDHAFTVSGGGCIHLIDALRLAKGMDTTCVHHEQTALMASEGYYRQSGKMALNVITTGPGGTNALTGLLGMWLDSIPSMVISGQVSTNQLSEGTGCRQIGDQEFNIVKVAAPMTKYCVTIKDKSRILYELEKAYQIALHDRMGPVWIDVPLDIQGADVDEEMLDRFTEVIRVMKPFPSEIVKFKKLLLNAKKPLIVCGSGVRLSNSYTLLNDLLVKTGIPAVTGPHSAVDCIDNTYEYYAGRIGIHGQLTSNEIVQQCDLLIILGSRLNFKMTGYNIKDFAPNAKKIIVDIDEFEIMKHKFHIDLKIPSDLKEFLSYITMDNETLQIGEWQQYVKDKRKEQVYCYPQHIHPKQFASFYYFISRAPKYFGKLPIVTSNGSAHVVTQQTYNINKGQRLYTNVGCASMGYGISAAIGACKASNMRVVCIEGDGSIMMNLQELQTIKHNNLPIKIIIVNNDGYVSIKLTQGAFFGGAEFASGKDNGVSLPSFEKIAKAFGIDYYSIKSNADVDGVLSQSMTSYKPCIIEVFVNPSEKHEPKVTHRGIDANGKIIPGTLTDMTISKE